jgi:hypothetical protein
MDRFEQDLIARHQKASKAYRKAVIELERHRRSGNRQRFISFRAEVVTPARLRCLGLFQQWWQMRRETGEETLRFAQHQT